MPPKVDSAGEGASATPVKDTPAKTGKADSSEGDFKLAWASELLPLTFVNMQVQANLHSHLPDG